jgi:hypothetical protein
MISQPGNTKNPIRRDRVVSCIDRSRSGAFVFMAYDTYQDGTIAVPPHQPFVLYDAFLGDLLR